MLLHRLAGLDSYARKGNAHAHRNHHCLGDGNPVNHPIDDERSIPHPQPADRYIDIHPHFNIHIHGHTHSCAFVDSIPATYADVYPQTDVYSQLDTHPANGNVHILTGAAYVHPYPRPANGDIYILTGAAKRNRH